MTATSGWFSASHSGVKDSDAKKGTIIDQAALIDK
jgi:hypothetical protein